MKGTRVQAIIRELRGEKIDIVEFSDDPVEFVMNAHQPGQASSACRSSTTSDRVMEVVVEDKQLSLAIGKKGQNVRLAAKLTGWKIDIKSEEEKRKEVEAQLAGFDWNAVAEGQAEVPPHGSRGHGRPVRSQHGRRDGHRAGRGGNRHARRGTRPVGDASPHGLDEGPDADGVGEAKQD